MRTCSRPDWTRELRLARSGCGRVAGLDEVGRGSLAGPVVAAAVVLGRRVRLPGLNDSKLLTAEERETVLRLILRKAVAWSIGSADAEEIDRVNILNATRLAMSRAVDGLPERPDHLLLDAIRLPGLAIPQTDIIGGDRLSVSIAAASIVAKVARDRLMGHFHHLYPEWGFATHKGYGTTVHLSAIATHGPSLLHRRTFRGVLPTAGGISPLKSPAVTAVRTQGV